LYEVEYFGDGLYAIDEGNGLTLMLPRTSKKFAEAIAQALQAAYAKGQKDKQAEWDQYTQFIKENS
jgi:hypothetical protein